MLVLLKLFLILCLYIEFAICIKSLPTFGCLTRGSEFESPRCCTYLTISNSPFEVNSTVFSKHRFFQSKGRHSSSSSVMYFAILKGICCCVSLCLGFMQSSVDRIWFYAVVFNIEKEFEARNFLGSRKQPETEFSFNCTPSIVSLCFI